MGGFADAVAIVTGGASGIGRAIGEELVRRKARVVLADIDAEAAQAPAGAMTPAGAASGVRLDVRDAEAGAQRTQFLERLAVRVPRFWNNEVLHNADAVLRRIQWNRQLGH